MWFPKHKIEIIHFTYWFLKQKILNFFIIIFFILKKLKYLTVTRFSTLSCHPASCWKNCMSLCSVKSDLEINKLVMADIEEHKHRETNFHEGEGNNCWNIIVKNGCVVSAWRERCLRRFPVTLVYLVTLKMGSFL